MRNPNNPLKKFHLRFFQRIVGKPAGFTLFEMVLVIALVTTASVALLQALGTGLFAGRENENETVAANLAQEKIEELRKKSFSGISSETRAAVSGFSPYEREVVVSTVQTGLKQATVNVYWTSKSATLSSSLVTYASDI